MVRSRATSPTTSLVLPRLREDQRRIVNHPARLKCVAMGRRWGKTLMAGTLAVSVANHGGAVAWVVPTYKNARPTWRFCSKLVTSVGSAVAVNRTERTIEFPSGGWLGVYSADNDVGLRGESFDLVIVDEAAQVGEETYTDVILPTLADRDGRCILISTPKGLNWFYVEYMAALSEMEAAEREGRQPDRASWQAPTTANPMPTIQRAAELAQERVSERTYLQEWRAEFLAEGDGPFRKVLEAATGRLQDYVGGHVYTMGCDWGKVNDFTVLCVVDATTGQQVALERFNKIDYAFQIERVEDLYHRYRPVQILAEVNAMGVPIIEQLQRRRLPVYAWNATNASKAYVIERLGLAFERSELTILSEDACPAAKVQRGELLAYTAQRLPSGMIRYAAPAGMHDDTVLPLALAWGAASKPTKRVTQRDFEMVAD